MMSTLFLVCFYTGFAMVPVWFGLSANLLRILRTRHPEKYAALGSPTLIMNNSIANGRSMFRFLWKREDRSLGDLGLSKLVSFMRVFYVIFMVIFMFTFAVIVTGHAPSNA